MDFDIVWDHKTRFFLFPIFYLFVMSDNVKKALDPPPPSPANYLQTQQKCHYVKASLSTGFLTSGY